MQKLSAEEYIKKATNSLFLADQKKKKLKNKIQEQQLPPSYDNVKHASAKHNYFTIMSEEKQLVVTRITLTHFIASLSDHLDPESF